MRQSRGTSIGLLRRGRHRLAAYEIIGDGGGGKRDGSVPLCRAMLKLFRVDYYKSLISMEANRLLIFVFARDPYRAMCNLFPLFSLSVISSLLITTYAVETNQNLLPLFFHLFPPIAQCAIPLNLAPNLFLQACFHNLFLTRFCFLSRNASLSADYVVVWKQWKQNTHFPRGGACVRCFASSPFPPFLFWRALFYSFLCEEEYPTSQFF